MLKKCHFRGMRAVVLVVSLVFFAGTLGGCVSLRRKFTRKHKKKEETEEIPILEPVEYPAKVYTAAELYHKHYGLWDNWYNELLFDLSQQQNKRREAFLLSKALDHLKEMRGLLDSEYQKKLDPYIAQLKEKEQILHDRTILRDYATLKIKLESIYRKIRKSFKPRDVKDHIQSAQ